jgi:hypothetical protein
LFSLFITQYKYAFDFINWLNKDENKLIREFIKDYSTIFGFLSIPFFYFLGQIIQSLDVLFIAIIKRTRNTIKLKSGNVIFKTASYVFDRYRITGSLNLQNIDVEDFWQKTAKLQVENKYSGCEYWYVMNELFKGLTLTCLVLGLISLIKGSNSWIMISLSILFWFRAKHFVDNFIRSVIKSYNALPK